MLENFKNNVDIYDDDIEEIKDKCKAFELEIISEIYFENKQYLFVKKDNLVTQRSLLRSIGYSYIQIFIDGIWMDNNLSIDDCDNVINKVYGSDYIRGPYKTYFLKFMNRSEINKFENKVYDYFNNNQNNLSFIYG
jgi:hypothetical protein